MRFAMLNTPRRPLVAANWKMNTTLESAQTLAAECRRRLGAVRDVEVVLCPPYPFLLPVGKKVEESTIRIGAQDLHFDKPGAFTGAVGAEMLRSIGCTHVIIGHSERRHVFGESDAVVCKKIGAALKAELVPIFCVGEKLEERDGGTTFEVTDTQLRDGLAGFDANALHALVVAYEPVWAIGTGRTATPSQAQEVHAFIRERLAGRFGKDFATRCRVLYGGSVKADNIAGLMSEPDIDGALVGGASLDAEGFSQIVRYRLREVP